MILIEGQPSIKYWVIKINTILDNPLISKKVIEL